MLQIIDHSLARMRLSTHTTVLAEMAIIRLAALEDLDNLSEIISGIKPADEKKKLTPEANQQTAKTDQSRSGNLFKRQSKNARPSDTS